MAANLVVFTTSLSHGNIVVDGRAIELVGDTVPQQRDALARLRGES